MATQQIKIGSKFFEKELQVYANWAEAWWRENIQNSVDAGASRIDIKTESLSYDNTRVTFGDNGSGMNRSTLEETYFVLGETGKSGFGSIGGFGKARILTCFAQHKYTLHTNNLLATGSGADYEIADTVEFREGVNLIVDVKNDEATLLAALKGYLELCYLPARVFINGVQWKTWTYARNMKRELSFGKVYTNHSKDARLLVRVNGTLMFAKYINSPAQVILEIDPEKSRKVLLANRDGLVWDRQRELESFVNELNVNRRSALTQKTNKSTTFKGKGTFAMKRKGVVVVGSNGKKYVEPAKAAVALNLSGGKMMEVPIEQPVRSAERVEVDGPTLAETTPAYVEPTYDPEGPTAPVAPQVYHNRMGAQTTREDVEVKIDLFDVKIDDDTTNPKIKRIIESYDPRNWDLAGNGYRVRNGERQYFRAGVDKYKLLLLWKVACEKVMETLLNHFPQAAEGYNWGVGWVFSDYESGEGYKTMARHATDGGVHYLLVNPVNDDGTMAYSIGSKDDLVKLLGYAKHEVTHLVCSLHDEDFAGLMTELMIKVDQQQGNILKAMKEAKENLTRTLEAAGT